MCVYNLSQVIWRFNFAPFFTSKKFVRKNKLTWIKLTCKSPQQIWMSVKYCLKVVGDDLWRFPDDFLTNFFYKKLSTEFFDSWDIFKKNRNYTWNLRDFENKGTILINKFLINIFKNSEINKNFRDSKHQ